MIVKIPLMAKVPLTLEPQPEGGYTVTSPLLPELLTEGDTIEEVLVNVQDSFDAVLEMYEDTESPLPVDLVVVDRDVPVTRLETAVAVS
jgi:antitoxin HicB